MLDFEDRAKMQEIEGLLAQFDHLKADRLEALQALRQEYNPTKCRKLRHRIDELTVDIKLLQGNLRSWGVLV